MMKQDLKDTSFLIYVRIDSEDRRTNLGLVIRHLQKYFDTSILLWEIDDVPKIDQKIRKSTDLHYRFLKDSDPVLHTTKYRNAMVRQCNTPYFFICDTDVIAAPEALWQCVVHLRDIRNKTLVYPYNGSFYNIPKSIRKLYLKSEEYDFLKAREDKFHLWFRYSTGGIFGGRRKDFEKSGPDNVDIYGWGPDDKERYYRLKKQGFAIERSSTPLYHLYHDRKANSWHADKETKIRNEQEYLKLFQNG